MNCVVAGHPAATTLAVADAFLAAAPDGPLTLLSDDTPALLRALERPELARCEALWADAAVPTTVDDALVHRRMLHGRPDVVVVVVDEGPGAGDLAAVLAPRLGGTPLVLTGRGATATARQTVLGEASDDGVAPVCIVVPGTDPAAVLRAATDLVRSTPPAPDGATPLLSGHCAH